MTIVPSVPPFTIPSDADDATRHALLVCFRVTEAKKQLRALDRAHARLLPLLMDLDPEIGDKYVLRALGLRDYFPELVRKVDDIHAFASPVAREYQEAKYKAIREAVARRLAEKETNENSSDSSPGS